MWSKQFRIVLYTLVYEYYFWEEKREFSSDDVVATVDQLGIKEDVDAKSIISHLGKIISSKDQLEEKVKKHVAQWGKTYEMIKACLYVGAYEITTQKTNLKEGKEVATRYVHIAQDFVGGKNPSLVHAVLCSVAEEMFEG